MQKTVFSLCSFTLLALYSCQEEITLNLNEAEPKIVIEAEITDEIVPHTIRISHTINYDEPNNFAGISNATVVVSDDNGVSETLDMDSAGYYSVKTLHPSPTHNYFLHVSIDDNIYTSQCCMPYPVAIDTIYMRTYSYGDMHVRTPEIRFTDILGEQNFYRIKCFVNNKLQYTSLPTDEGNDGKQITATIMVDNPVDEANRLKDGDTIRVELFTITEEVRNYFRTLNHISSSSPSNPISNISNTALGYFNVCGVSRKTIVVEP